MPKPVHASMKSKSISVIVVSLLLASSVGTLLGVTIPANAPIILSSAQGAGSCPPDRTINFALNPIPQSFNYFNLVGTATAGVASLEYLSLTPFPLEPNGSLDWTESLSNWMTSNSNFTQWTFHIRPGAMWSNGTAVNASDVVDWASPSYALNPTYDFVGLHTQVKSVQAVNSDTVTFNLNVSNAQFPNLVSSYYYAPVVSPQAIALGPADPLFGPQVVDGPWYLANYTSGSTSALMLPNPYWNGLKPTACALHVIFVENSAQYITFLISGQADYTESLSYGNIAALNGSAFIHLNIEAGAAATPLWYNVTSYPYNMTQFRQALAYSINSSDIVQRALFGFGVTSNDAQGGVPSSIAFYNPNQTKYPYNVTKALSLLHSIGFTGGGSAGPLKFPNGTAMSTTIFTDSSKAYDIDITRAVQGFLQNLGISVQAQTLTSQNLASDYASNAFNIRNNLVIYTSQGPVYFSPWLDAQQGCNVMGTPGCSGWTATPSPSSPAGNTQWLYPASADAEYQSNLTGMDHTAPTNTTGEEHYLNNIQDLTAQYLPVVMLDYPDLVRPYSTQHWTGWPSFYFGAIGENITMFDALRPATSSTTTGSSSSASTTGVSSTTGSITSTATSSIATTSMSTATSTTSSSVGTIELVAAVVVVIIVIGGVAAFLMRRRT